MLAYHHRTAQEALSAANIEGNAELFIDSTAPTQEPQEVPVVQAQKDKDKWIKNEEAKWHHKNKKPKHPKQPKTQAKLTHKPKELTKSSKPKKAPKPTPANETNDMMEDFYAEEMVRA
ncbi:hypothetical protein DSO57_1008765 [Entomophthora muscae]|uniref:Uncharacterized protein n=1 Tax=Entomophthora muscae TaxID=34485 RepID=A0ACC2UGS9_9FUNG|nr:hypothetical protein DSO57_1008765 [Entomophthora muscae]